MKRTKGHTCPITRACWKDEKCFITSSLDGTIRIWDSEKSTLGHKEILVVKSKKGKTSVSAFAYEPRQNFIAVSSITDGNIFVYDMRRLLSPSVSFGEGHQQGTFTTSLCFDPGNSSLFASRGGANDDCIKCMTDLI